VKLAGSPSLGDTHNGYRRVNIKNNAMIIIVILKPQKGLGEEVMDKSEHL